MSYKKSPPNRMKPALTLSGGEVGGRERREVGSGCGEGGGRESKGAQCRQKVFSYEERK